MVEIDRAILESLPNASLEGLEELEKKCFFSTFDHKVAFGLGCQTRSWAMELFPQKPVVIDISLPGGQCLFHATTASGTVLDNDIWIQRKKNTVFRFGHSSFYMGRKLSLKGDKTVEEAMYVSSKEYAVHGGAVPIKLESSDTTVACLTVSGLKQEVDHLLAVTAIVEYANRLLQTDLNLD